jgi:hypothetical protein
MSMAEIEQDGYGNEVYGSRMLSIDEYAERIGKSPRVVKRALYGEDSYMIPGAVRDAEDRWRIPENAERVRRPAGAEAPTTGLQLVPDAFTAGQPAPGAAVAQWGPPPAPVEPTLREEMDNKPGFLSIADAAEFLGIPEAQIRANAERFALEPVGYNGSLRVPQRVIRRIMGV